MSEDDKCSRCYLPATFDSPRLYCDEHWARWWGGFDPEDRDRPELQVMYEEALETAKQIKKSEPLATPTFDSRLRDQGLCPWACGALIHNYVCDPMRNEPKPKYPDWEQLSVQLAGCAVAALGGIEDSQVAKRGDYGWSPSYQDVLNLREKYEQLLKEKACPCLHTDPCSDRCTCVEPGSSRGCSRCCTYGSEEQQAARAKRLAELIDDAKYSSYSQPSDEVMEVGVLSSPANPCPQCDTTYPHLCGITIKPLRPHK